MPIRQNNWDIYLFALKIGLSSFIKGNFIIGLKQFLYPIGYWRFPVFPIVCNRLDNDPKKILDIGSPKLLSLYLSLLCGHEVFATDLQDKLIFERYSKHFHDYLFYQHPKSKYITEFQDGRELNYPDNYFDYVYSISVIEHIPADGDSRTMEEINRVLKPTGKAIIEVPFSKSERETYLSESVFDRQYENKPVFFQRHYDKYTLSKRLIYPSKLKLIERIVTVEKVPFEKHWSRIPFPIKNLLLWTESISSSLNHYFLVDDQIDTFILPKDRAMNVILILEK